ncbi:MAG: hypothetical protein JWO20_2516 [Candidatus Angelobacter sp.]|nr:hypothetical protein [Candidatus Angelobacter sp.]
MPPLNRIEVDAGMVLLLSARSFALEKSALDDMGME